ncbi:MAG TPA: winged helix-turn-helix transcriptional regulator [Candidatus Thermoplasmatota archaeon]|jgi:predicted transcriptional regulator|nr:winged helix-turn-helix transcriptional regulator [Candidatus Thermoplasmatota archaeon]
MRELRGCIARLSVGTVLVLLSLAPIAAANDAHQLVVQGPLDLQGPSALHADDAGLLFQGDDRDPGSFRMVLQAASLHGSFTQIEEMCVAPALGLAQLPSTLDRPLRLEPDAILGLAAPPVALQRDPADVAEPAIAPIVETTALAVGSVAEAAAATIVASAPEGPLPCFGMQPGPREEAYDLTQVSVEITPETPGFTVLWDATSSEHGGAATLQADRADAQLLTTDQDVALVDGESVGYWTSAPRAALPAGAVRSEAPAGHGGFGGEARLLLYGAAARVTGLTAQGKLMERVFHTGESQESSGPGPTKRVLAFLDVQIEDGSGAYESPSPVALYGQRLTADLDGGLGIPEAHGAMQLNGEERSFDGAALLEGPLSFALRGVESDDGIEDAPGDAMLLQLDEPVAATQSPWVEPPAQESVATTAAAVGGFAVVAGLLAYFWPSLKLFVAPLYTRIAPDAVLMHGARENIYRLIKAEPGIHAHEVASRLTLGWGTTVYHLKLLERNGLVVARHEGRYKRFFVTGDLHLQHQEAVAMLRNATSRAIATTVASRPGLIQKEVCEALGLSPSLASWHLQRLETAGVVRSERMGRSVRYAPGPAWVELQALAPAPIATPAPVLPPAAGPSPAMP